MKKQNKFLTGIVLLLMVIIFSNCTEDDFHETNNQEINLSHTKQHNTAKKINPRFYNFYIYYTSNVTESQKQNIRNLFIDSTGENFRQINLIRDEWHINEPITIEIAINAIYNNCPGCLTSTNDGDDTDDDDDGYNEPTNIPISEIQSINTIIPPNDNDDSFIQP